MRLGLQTSKEHLDIPEEDRRSGSIKRPLRENTTLSLSRGHGYNRLVNQSNLVRDSLVTKDPSPRK